MLVKVTYGIGYGSHETELDLPDDYDDEDIETAVSDHVNERVEWSWKRELGECD